MFKTPDYTKYTLEELFEAHASVNRDKYPENYALINNEIEKKQKGNYKCPKCGFGGFESGQLYAPSSRSESILDYESGKFITISCLECGFTELYKGKASKTGTFLDFLIS